VTALVLANDPNAVSKPENLPPINLDGSVAEQFRAYMMEGMTMTGHGRFRRDFYKRVVTYAEDVVCVES
jgi:hypothetical protein